MKPYSFRGDGTDDTGCCPGHDWPVTKRWSGSYSSKHSKKSKSKANTTAKRSRRRTDKSKLKEEK